jgi:uncharacterized protein YfiM (DUF2279 family)
MLFSTLYPLLKVWSSHYEGEDWAWRKLGKIISGTGKGFAPEPIV